MDGLIRGEGRIRGMGDTIVIQHHLYHRVEAAAL